MTYALRFSGTTRVSEGETATVTVTRTGDLSKRVHVVLDSMSWWGVYNPTQQVSHGDVQNIGQNGDGSGVLIFEPGVSQASVSISTFNDGVNEGREVMTVGYNIYEDVNGILVSPQTSLGIDNSANPWPRDGNATIGSWTIMVDDPGQAGSATPQPANQPTHTQPTPGAWINGNNNWVNTGTNYTVNSTTQYIDNSINNTYYADNSVNSYSLSYVTNANDYSIAKTLNGSGKLRGTDANDLLTGSKKNDRLYGNLGNDELIGGNGKDSLYGGLGSNIFNAGLSRSRKDADRLYVQREGSAASADIIESIGRNDRVYIQGATGDLSVRAIDGGLGIYDNDILQAIYTGNNFNASTLNNQLVAS